MIQLSKRKEEGLEKYRKVQHEISVLENRLIRLAEKGQTDNGLVTSYNSRVDELGKIAEYYELV